jgi:electron transfer flavoprotein alpha/beta subunit
VKSRRLAGVAAELVLGLVGPADLSNAAVAALEQGLDSPALIALASDNEDDPSEAQALFVQALDQLDLDLPTPREAIIYLAKRSAAEIVQGTVAPYVGAKRIWDLTLRAPGVQVGELDPFIYAASEWEERPEDRALFEQGIRSEARALLGD